MALCFNCVVVVCVRCCLLTVTWVGRLSVTVAIPRHSVFVSSFLISKFNCISVPEDSIIGFMIINRSR